MNQSSADIRREPHARSEAEVRRSSGGRERPKKAREPFHALKMQKALSAVSYGQRVSIKAKISETESFDDFPLLPLVKESIATQALSGMVDLAPTPIQRLAIPVLLGNETRAARRRSSASGKKEMEQFLLAAETGSGKTLAYLLPVLDAIKRAEVIDAELEVRKKAEEEEERKKANYHALEPPPLSNAPHPTTGRPRAIILVPTSELVTQVGNLAKLLSHTVKFRSGLISSAYSGKVIRNRLFAPTGIDVLISTPHLLASISESDPNILSCVSHLIIDEADSLLDRSFAPSTSTVIDKSTPSLQQLILCSATIPRSLDSYLRKRFPDMRRLVTPNLHAIPRRVQLGVVDVEKEPYRGNKTLACADTIWSIGKAAAEHAPGDTERVDIKRILVFVNEREKTQEVAEYLNSKGIDAVALNRDTPEQRQSETLGAFTTIQPKTAPEIPKDTSTPSSGTNYIPFNSTPSTITPPPRRHLPNTKVLVTTDLGSRGIDTLAVRHVILYDVPHSTIDFIHRLGRTGRMGRRGRGIVLVGKNDRRDVVREVKEGMFKGQALI
ncbi:RNA helicase [Imshaugia aleurites]|uniref:RNA helicase n=1 Tax=Imshaugia aleurites TaxID=172621 RepID=A0A8H3F5F8_9LECA|nr:RNA helicase [Imshaugia aleurites]